MAVWTRILIAWLFLWLGCSAVHAAYLTAIKLHPQQGKTTVIFNLTGLVMQKVFTLANPERVIVDLARTDTRINFRTVHLANSNIKSIRSGYSKEHDLRLVFDVAQPVQIKTSVVGQILSIEFLDKINHVPLRSISKTNEKRVTSTIKIAREKISTPNKINGKHTPIQVRHGPSHSLRDVIIVLDPGHGGKDPGAMGPKHNAEKNVVLAIATKLKETINKQPGMRAVLTREKDYYVGLRERLNIARKYNADIFISIHADAFINQHSNGASVFALSQRGATSEAARWLAEKENNSELGGVNLSGLDDGNGLIRTVLLDLSQTATISASVHMGARVLHNLGNITTLHNSKVEQARFVVLKSPDIPSILIETGFISNPREESNLTNTTYQTRLTQAIFNGLKRYFWDYPPQGTRIESFTGVNIHIVKPGERLASIAARYHVTPLAIKTANHLTSEHLHTGQKLSIPLSWD